MSTNYWNKRKKAFGYAFRGIAALFSGEAHAKIHIVATLLVIILGLILKIARWEWCVILLCIGGVLMAEAFNTAIERVCDRVSPDYHPLIRDAKDIAAAAVLLFVIAAVIIGLIIFVPKFIQCY